MIDILIEVAFVIGAYLIGSIPWALIISKIAANVDIRNYGSKNMGATNTLRVLGFKCAILCFFLDALKAFDSNDITIHFTGEVKPFVLTSDYDVNHIQLMLPYRI